jgi:type II secretory pathway predicted ATPase ExeA/phage tail protein X
LAKRETFYTAFYGFRSSPFHVTPDPDNLLLTEAHKHALGAIYYGIVARKGFVVVTGEVGVGKTSVLRASLDRLDTTATKIVYLFNPRLTPTELYETILTDLGESLGDRRDALNALQHLLLRLYNSGLNVVLAIDEAQNIPEGTLEDLRLLSNLETRSDKLLQIVLVGQPELDATLAQSSLRQLKQRIAVRATIPAMSLKQSFRYMRHRVTVAGRGEDIPLFSFSALMYIAYAASGNPRKLNIYCDNALINGLGHRAERITLSIAREALRHFKLSVRGQAVRGWLIPIATSVVILVAAGGLAVWAFVHGPIAGSRAMRSVTASVAKADPELVTREPRTEVVAAPTDAPGDASVVWRAFAANDERGEPSLSIAASTDGTATTVKPMTEPEHSFPGAMERTESVSPFRRDVKSAAVRADGSIEVAVRSGDSLSSLCIRVYGRCDSLILRHVLESNPGLRSINLIVRGQTLVFQPYQTAERGSE